MRTIAVLAAVLLAAAPAAAATLTVPGDYGSIQDAVDAASNGDTIQVDPGTWVGRVQIKGVTDLTLAGKKGAVVDGAGAIDCLYVESSKNVTVTGLTFEDAGGDAVTLVDSTGILFDRCTFMNSGMNGLFVVACDRVEVTRCAARNLGSAGIRVQPGCQHVLIGKCLVEDTGDNGICLSFEGSGTAGVPHATIEKNTVRRAGRYGIVAGGDHLLIAKNVVEQANYRGIAIDDSTDTSGALVTGNTVVASAVEGIVLHWSGNTALKNRVDGSGGAGILVRGSDHLVEGNRIDGGLAAGIAVEGKGCEVLKNKVAGSVAGGVTVTGDDNVFTGNSVAYLLTGFIVDGTSNTFEKNRAKSCADWDLVDSTGPGGNTYVDIDRQFPHRNMPSPP